MNSAFARDWQPILAAGLLCGAMDITAAFLAYSTPVVTPARILQSIASGLLGPAAFRGGNSSAALGLSLHFLIAFVAAAVYYFASRKLPVLIEHAWLTGPLYGAAVHLFMSFVVVPLSNAAKRPFSARMFLLGLVIHLFCVGLPIALATRYFAMRPAR